MRLRNSEVTGLHEAARAADRFAMLARAQVDHPSERMAARVAEARAVLLEALARVERP